MGAFEANLAERTGTPALLETSEDGWPQRGRKPPLRADVQGLRGVAVLLVVAAHVFNHPRGGFIGVDVFFVISGYLITGLLVREREDKGRISIREFYARRARRILPVAVLVLIATDIAGRLIFSTVRAHQTVVDSAWAMGFLANFHFIALGTSYFEAARPPSAVQQYWSLAVEEQFYLVWPCLLIVAFLLAKRVGRVPPRAVVGVLAGVVVCASFGFALSYTKTNPTGSYFSAASRAWELGLGALTVIVQPWILRLHARTRAVASWLGLGAIIASAFAISLTTPFPSWAALAPVLATAVVLGVGPVRFGIGHRWAFGSMPSLYLGNISYSLYLWHWPLLIFARAYYGKATTQSYVLGSIGALALSVVSYQLIENPIRRSLWLSRKTSGYVRNGRGIRHLLRDRRPLLVMIVVALLGVVALQAWQKASEIAPVSELVAANAGLAPGVPAPVPTVDPAAPLDPLAAQIKLSIAAQDWPKLDPSLDSLHDAAAPEWTHDHCIDVFAANEARCVYGSGSHLAVLVGDSIAVSYLPGIRAAFAGTEWKVQVLTVGQCPMVDTPTKASEHSVGPSTRCIDHRKFAIDEIERLQPDMVISASSFAYIDNMVDAAAKGSPQNYSRWREATQRMMTSLGSSTRPVVLVGAPPGTENLQECVTVQSSPSDCARRVQPRWFGVHDADMAAARAAGARYVDPVDWFCFYANCPGVIGTTPVFWDGTHMTAAYSRTLAPQLRKALIGS